MPQVCYKLYLSQLWVLSGWHCVSCVMWSPTSGDSLGKGCKWDWCSYEKKWSFLYNADIQGVSLYNLEVLTIKMQGFIQSYVKNLLAEVTGKCKVWGTSMLSVGSSPLRSWVGNEPELPKAESSLIPLPREVIIVYNTWLMFMSLVVQLRSWGLVGCRSIDLLRHLWGRKTEM